MSAMVTVTERADLRRGLLHGVLAYSAWGVVPLFWRLLIHVDAAEIVAHRTLWGFVTFALVVRASGQWARFLEAWKSPRTLALMALSAALLALNWGTFVFAVMTDRLLDASLGYFINPLVSVALGAIVLRERLRPMKWAAIALAGTGVAWLTWHTGRLPWMAVMLAVSFGLYGLIRKRAPVDALIGSTIETALATPIAVGYLVWLAAGGRGALGHADVSTHALLVATGVITAGPLMLFTSAARRLPLATVGFLQYLAPTGQFLVAVFAFGEPLAPARLAAFGWIWAGLALFTIDLWRTAMRPLDASKSSHARRKVDSAEGS
jgi:chloramphenicol-sensitive protein RarD